ncbi:MAG: sporulation protein YqfD [Bacilli bacterium]|nr:sporulation protein YqfD [Bacilli bacterium]
MNSFLYIKITGYSWQKIAQKLRSINVSVYEMYEKNDAIYIKIVNEDYEKITKYLKTLKFQKVKYTGPEYLRKTIKRYRLLLCALFSSIILVFLSSHIIVDIDVVHEDDALVNLITEELEIYGVKKFRFQKSYNQLQEIKSKIKNKHLDKIDWLEINKIGMKYVVRVEERIITSTDDKKDYCHLYASKDALVTRIKTFDGEAVVGMNDYVKKGDLLISGDIKLNEEVVENVCASGEVYAEVWYEVNIKVPFEYYASQKTGKSRNNLIFNYDGIDHQIFKDRIKEYEEKRKLIFDLLGVKIYLKTEEEIKKTKYTYTEDEAIEKAVELAKEKVALKLKDTDKIISQKILQKTIIDSTMDIDIFIVAEEEISSQVEARKEVENGL